MKRDDYNRILVSKLLTYINRYPEIRFWQALVAMGIIKYDKENKVIDSFYEESKDTLNNLKDC